MFSPRPARWKRRSRNRPAKRTTSATPSAWTRTTGPSGFRPTERPAPATERSRYTTRRQARSCGRSSIPIRGKQRAVQHLRRPPRRPHPDRRRFRERGAGDGVAGERRASLCLRFLDGRAARRARLSEPHGVGAFQRGGGADRLGGRGRRPAGADRGVRRPSSTAPAAFMSTTRPPGRCCARSKARRPRTTPFSASPSTPPATSPSSARRTSGPTGAGFATTATAARARPASST